MNDLIKKLKEKKKKDIAHLSEKDLEKKRLKDAELTLKEIEIKLPSNHKFGFFFSTIFLLASLYSYYIDSEIMAYVLGTLCGTFLVITIINAKILLPLNKLWMKFGILLGMIVSPIIMGIIYFGIFTPIAIIMRLAGRDELRLRLKKQKTHWINRKILKRIDSFKNQF